MNRFINREAELAFLNKLYTAKGSQLIVLWGKRRVGKTELIKAFCNGKAHVYFLADKTGTKSNLLRLAKRLADYFNEIPPAVETFDDLFSYLLKKIGRKKFILAIDEFAYLIEKDKAIPSIFQRIWDEMLSGSNLFLILCGSSIGMMKTQVIGYKSPLYGRRTGQWELAPFSFSQARGFFPKLGLEDQINVYAFLGGTPAYLTHYDVEKSLEENIKKIITKGYPLCQEPLILLREELRDPSSYVAILAAIAAGATTLSEIASKAGIDAKDLPAYLKNLMMLRLVERRIPVTYKKFKRGVYKLTDNFFSFWFRFCYPNQSDLEEGNIDKVWHIIKKEFKGFVSFSFEKVCEEALKKIATKLRVKLDRIGNWWWKGVEINIVGIDEDGCKLLLAECKWQEKVDAQKLLKELKRKAELIKWQAKEVIYVLFAKSFRKKFKERGLFLFDLNDLKQVFRSSASKKHFPK